MTDDNFLLHGTYSISIVRICKWTEGVHNQLECFTDKERMPFNKSIGFSEQIQSSLALVWTNHSVFGKTLLNKPE